MSRFKIIKETIKQNARDKKGIKLPDYVNNQGKEYFHPETAFNRSQMKSLATHPDYQKYVGGMGGREAEPEGRVYVRKEKGRYFVANAKQQHMLRLHMDKKGRVYGCTVYKKVDSAEDPAGWAAEKHTTIQDLKMNENVRYDAHGFLIED